MLDCYYGYDGELGQADYDEYIILLRELIYLGAGDQVNSMLQLTSRFEKDISSQIGDLFMQVKVYDKAIEQFKEALNRGHTMEAELYYKIGYCYYRLFDYGQAMQFMDKALKSGYSGNEVYEFISWVKEKKITG